jgi:hypothetical protein
VDGGVHGRGLWTASIRGRPPRRVPGFTPVHGRGGLTVTISLWWRHRVWDRIGPVGIWGSAAVGHGLCVRLVSGRWGRCDGDGDGDVKEDSGGGKADAGGKFWLRGRQLIVGSAIKIKAKSRLRGEKPSERPSRTQSLSKRRIFGSLGDYLDPWN